LHCSRTPGGVGFKKRPGTTIKGERGFRNRRDHRSSRGARANHAGHRERRKTITCSGSDRKEGGTWSDLKRNGQQVQATPLAVLVSYAKARLGRSAPSKREHRKVDGGPWVD